MCRNKWILAAALCLTGCTPQSLIPVPEEPDREDTQENDSQEEQSEEITMEQYWENGTYYTVADEKAVKSLYHYSVAGEDVSRERLDPHLVIVKAVKLKFKEIHPLMYVIVLLFVIKYVLAALTDLGVL